MRSSIPFPGQNDNIFRDKFHKWPKLMRYLVLVSLLPAAFLLIVSQMTADDQSLQAPCLIAASFNVALFCWGMVLKLKARKYWYRQYHIGKTMLVALLPVLVSTYLILNSVSPEAVASQPLSRSVQISIN
ncbi:hypothetical protein [Photobacterium sp. 1_MG-2023]|uniref:hypothetical protein n=1 Tax=Photobacterium sp. 1_MG-2023 TaxID=3062646 RepID=UPI0026E40F91|nr:hypothetical protein [Photobacterium sp. 1_MG-2023]MDO6705458.1 hypothetical protein [Photobacterium sp. 1_MG-2023]